MSYEIKCGSLLEIQRISNEHQPLLLSVESYNHTLLKAPIVSTKHPSWDYKFSFIASSKERLKFYLHSLHPNTFMLLLGQGLFDVRQLVDSKMADSFQARIPIYMSYENDMFLHLKLLFREEKRSRNQGICQFLSKSPSQVQKPNNILQKQNNVNSDVSFFRGPCQSRNIFSMMDTVFKGQTFTFIEPLKR